MQLLAPARGHGVRVKLVQHDGCRHVVLRRGCALTCSRRNPSDWAGSDLNQRVAETSHADHGTGVGETPGAERTGEQAGFSHEHVVTHDKHEGARLRARLPPRLAD